jgi:HAD superfamily hydrolase (TIGR01509 family)
MSASRINQTRRVRSRSTPRKAAQAVIFDMDGTLTRPMLDFDRIRQEIGLRREPVLEAVRRMNGEARRRAESILHRHEALAAARSRLQPGARAVLTALRRAGVPVALMTRNSRDSLAALLRRHRLQFDLTWTREDGPMKPSPTPVRRICTRLKVTPAATWVVGDFLFDVQCGRAAGAKTVLLLNTGSAPDWADQADFVIRDLRELLDVLSLSRTRVSVR